MKPGKSETLKVLLFLSLGAVLFALSFPSFLFKEGLGFLAWVSFVPVFLAVRFMKFRFSFLWGMYYGCLSYALFVFWMCIFNPLFYFSSLAFYSVIYGLLFVLFKLADYSMEYWGWVLECLLFLCFDSLKTRGPLGFGYGVMGYTQWKYLPLIQISSFTGVFGVSALILFASGFIFSIINHFLKKKELDEKIFSETHHIAFSPISFANQIDYLRKKTSLKLPVLGLSLYIIVFVAAFILGNKSYKKAESFETVKICAVQHNENPNETGFSVYHDNLRRLMNLTEEALESDSDIDIVVWPETAVTPSIMYQFYNGNDEKRVQLVNNLLVFMNSKEASFVIGNFHHSVQNGMEPQDYNAAFVFTPKENIIPPKPESYYKVHLVPLSEYFPFKERFQFVYKLLLKFGVNLWKPGTSYNVFNKNGFVFSTPICFEDTFGETGRKMFNAGARCFINITNDAWSQSEACQNQHLAMAVFRSVENRVPTVRSAASGQTCSITPEGKVENLADPFVPSYIICEVPVLSEDLKPTFYTKYGDWIIFVYAGLSVLMLIIGIIKGIIKLCQNR